jgi:hypothetical protein
MHDVLGHQLAHQAPPAGAERQAHADLARPCRGAAQHEVGHVAARDAQQHQREQPQQRQQLGRVWIARKAALKLADHDAAHGPVRVRVPGRELPEDRVGLGACRFDRHAAPQPPLHCEEPSLPFRELPVVGIAVERRGRGERHEEGRRAMSNRREKRIGHDADDVERAAVQTHRPADDGRIASERTHPVVAPEQQHRVAARVRDRRRLRSLVRTSGRTPNVCMKLALTANPMRRSAGDAASCATPARTILTAATFSNDRVASRKSA